MKFWTEGRPLGRFGSICRLDSRQGESLRSEGHFVVLAGLAGAGKTDLLRELTGAGEQVLDLEGLANHRGSVFGGLGMPPQPSHEHFQALVSKFVAGCDVQRPIWVEDEGPYLGSVGLPVWLQQAIAASPIIRLETPFEARVQRLIITYASVPGAMLLEAISRLRPRLGEQRADRVLRTLQDGDVPDAVRLVLPLYDAAYEHRMAGHSHLLLGTLNLDQHGSRAALGLARTSPRRT